MPQWDADLYLQFASERTQPVFDLLNRIHLRQPRRIADLGCGPGNSTEALRRHWPESSVVGVDRSAEMIRKARQDYPAGTWMTLPGDEAAIAAVTSPWDPSVAKVVPVCV